MKLRLRSRNKPRGTSAYFDIKRAFPDLRVETVIDIGANEGQSTETFLDDFPHAHMFCIEPSCANFEKLSKKFSGSKRISCFNLALSNETGTALLDTTGRGDMHRLVTETAEDNEKTVVQEVEVSTLDDFCMQHDLRHIHYLKVDTEGHELAVFSGANKMLTASNTSLVEVELGMNPENTYHTKFEDGKAVLEENGFRLFAIYEQVDEWPTKQPHLRRVNAIFASQKLL